MIQTPKKCIREEKGAFNNYVDRYLAIFDHPPIPLIDKCRHLGSHQPLVYVDILKMTTSY